jgi:hypothetical protein
MEAKEKQKGRAASRILRPLRPHGLRNAVSIGFLERAESALLRPRNGRTQTSLKNKASAGDARLMRPRITAAPKWAIGWISVNQAIRWRQPPELIVSEHIWEGPGQE